MTVVCFHDPDEENGYLSNWFLSDFTVDGIRFTSMEQYMMYQKAVLFNDFETAAKILLRNKPSEHKSLGRLVKGFDEDIWLKQKENIVYNGNYLKFTQNKDLKEILMATSDKLLVEANGEDKIWGIGMYVDDPNLLKTELWGQNLLGNTLTKLRDEIKNLEFFKLEKIGKFNNEMF